MVIIDAVSAKRVSVKKLARVTANESLADLFSTEIRQLLQGPILMNFDTINNTLYFALPNTRTVFILKLTKERLIPLIVGQMDKEMPKLIGILGTYNSDKEEHKIYSYDRVGVYEINIKAKSKVHYEEKLTEVNLLIIW